VTWRGRGDSSQAVAARETDVWCDMSSTILFVLVALAAEPRRIPFWPESVRAAIQKHVDGAYVLGAVRALGRHHRVQGSPGFRAATEWLVGELSAGGLSDAAVEHLPADGKTRYAHFTSYLGWNPGEGRLEELAPTRRVLA